ncbi:MAG: HAD family phosphatase [Bdellovibrionaceae bacterium]|nr:HAD family phosphatase [Bdellovibrionales bacterium]MCB9083380.1 HAD family phosphatase [Pseudobdellovibrionaceae bacterium]
MVKNIVFDLGGVLVDWNPRYLYQQVFKSADEMEYFLQYVCSSEWNARLDAGLSFTDGIEERCQACPHYSREIRLYWDRWPEMVQGEIALTVELFRHFQKVGSFGLYALSNWSSQTFPLVEKRFGFLGEFDGLILSGNEGVVKPDPKIFEILLNRYDLKATDCLFIDDSLENVKTALDMGFLALHFRDPGTLKIQLKQMGLLGSV